MRIVVSGRHGQLVRSLLERGAGGGRNEVVAIGRPQLDLERPETVEAAILAAAPDVVINAAAYTAVDQAEDEPGRAFLVNAEGAGALALAARAAGASFIQVSTDYVFDGRRGTPYDEDATPEPLGVYGRSKLEGEERVREVIGDHLILRTSWIYSPFGNNFVKTLMRLARERDEVSVVSDQVGNPTSALDVASGILSAIDHLGPEGRGGFGQVYHLAGTGACSWYDFAVETFRLCAEFGLPAARVRPIATADLPAKAQRPARSWLNSSRFEQDFSFRMPPWQVSLREVVTRLKNSES